MMSHLWEKLAEVLSYSKESPLLFNSGTFMGLFTALLLIYIFLYQRIFARTLFITLFSIYFYYKSSGEYVLILILSIIFNYWIAREISLTGQSKYRKLLLWCSILFNVGFLVYFKYTNFLRWNLHALFSRGAFHPWHIFLPIGISFYTFQTISYVIDVYKKTIPPTKNVLDFAFYLGFFPQLVAGPIVRARDFLPQIHQKITFTRENMGKGLFLLLKGLVKKAVIADFLSQYVDIIYANPGGYSGFENLMAMYAYTMQIYCDFSGYSDMAIGLALIMGFHLPDNFKSPYNALDITEFWRRWHITLSTWLRDYIYIPLGGNRQGEERQFLYLMITMLVGGLWHGADWKFVFWGGMHGLGLIVHKIFSQTARSLEWNQAFLRPLGWILTFHFVAFLWIFFRAQNFHDAALSIHQMVFHLDFAYFSPFLKANGLVFLIMSLGYLIHFVREDDKNRLSDYYATLPLLAKAAILVFIIQIILQIQNENVQPFIYFQF